MRSLELESSILGEQREFPKLVADAAASETDICLRSAAALAQVCRGIITGEGPTASGRVHFSRSVDIRGVALCPRLLVVAGRHGPPVSRPEADALLDVYGVASDRQDGGRFD